jgi:HEAT repeat protein
LSLLRQTLACGDPLVGGASLRKLAEIGSPSAVRVVAEVVPRLDEHLQVQALMALRELDHVEVVGAVLQLLMGPGHPRRSEVMEHAVRTASSLLRKVSTATESDLSILVASLECPYVQVARTAARVLGTCTDRRIGTPLLRACMRGDPLLSQAVGTCMKRWITAKQLGWLVKMLWLGDDRIARGAEAALVAIGGRAVGRLIKAVNWPYPRARLAAIRALGRIGDKRAVTVLRNAARDEDQRVREGATTALGAIRIPRM